MHRSFVPVGVRLILVEKGVNRISRLGESAKVKVLSFMKYFMHWEDGMNKHDMTGTCTYKYTQRILGKVSSIYMYNAY